MLKAQNQKLAENTKLIEERYKEVAEIAKKAVKAEVPRKEQIITIEDTAANLSQRKTGLQAQSNRFKRDSSPQKQDNLASKGEEGSSNKTLPKKPPASKRKVSPRPETKVAAKPVEPEEPKSFRPQPMSNNLRNHRRSPDAEGNSKQKSRGWFLLPQRENKESDSDDEPQKVGVIQTSDSDRQQAMRRKSERAAKKELLKREESKRNTLHEILKLKDEIAEVTTTFKSVDLEKKEQEIVAKKHQFQREINRKLECFESLAMRSSTLREKDDEEYLKSLRAALEEESSDDDLTRRALEIKKSNRRGGAGDKDGLQTGPNKNTNAAIARKIHASPLEIAADDSEEEEGTRIYRHPPKQAPLDAFPSSYKATSRASNVTKAKPAERTKGSKNQDYLETSEEEDNQRPAQSTRKMVKPAAKPKTEDPNLDGLTEDQLCLIRQMVDDRLKSSGGKPAKKSAKRPQTEEPELALDDDFYDNRFLNLVYELESQKDDSLFNY